MRICFKCKLPKENSEFSKETRAADGLSGRCRACHKINRGNRVEKIKEERKRYRAKNPKKLREDHLKYAHGISLVDYEKLLADQNGKCVICKITMEEPHIDHCHKTGKIRGLLCSPCNVGLGMLRDSSIFLRAAAEYLEKHAL